MNTRKGGREEGNRDHSRLTEGEVGVCGVEPVFNNKKVWSSLLFLFHDAYHPVAYLKIAKKFICDFFSMKDFR
jgi:hypothetical protein